MFTAADFEHVISLLSDRENSREQWFRSAARIRSRSTDSFLIVRGVDEDWTSVVVDMVKQAAAWIIKNCLRSPLGSPADVLSAINRILQSDVNLHRAGSVPSKSCWSSRCILEFVTELELELAHTLDASCACEQQKKKSDVEEQKVDAFFCANMNVYVDLLTRIRPILLELSIAMSRLEMRRHHYHLLAALKAQMRRYERVLGEMKQRINDAAIGDDDEAEMLETQVVEIENLLFFVCDSCVDVRDNDSIRRLTVG